jgi:hypothetical protein
VANKLSLEAAAQRDNDKRNDYDRKNRVRGQHPKIKRSRKAHASEPRDALAKADVIDKIRDQEQGGADDRANHARSMRGDAAAPNQKESANDQDSSRRIENGIQGWEEADLHKARRTKRLTRTAAPD